MKILALESSAKAASVALCENSDLLLQYFQNSGHTHSRTLLKMAEDLLGNIGLKTCDLDVIAVASGPGSFTGIRIGVSAAIGLAWGAGKPVCGVSTLEAMAYHAEDPEYTICPVMDARRGQVYNALFQNKDGSVVRLTPDRAIAVSDLAEEAKSGARTYMLLGDGAPLCLRAFNELGIPCRLAPPLLRLQSAWGVACASLNAPKVSPDTLKPNYLRVSQAERERNAKLIQTG
ncbi:MAG: tRNA (adenosine(37)-N6)-threonylcarbamoyltransferase complex dimerization subunit type 1 TsaB [Clostridiales bacterium]|nr:tRNA (adenosine(37)-N6)-threonylcarbamoyltransferase complex dimerization subunit type 1 TsaB [Clostridiales bacterium]